MLAYIRARSRIEHRLEREEGQALVEYALILSLVVVGAVVILTSRRQSRGHLHRRIERHLGAEVLAGRRHPGRKARKS